MCSGSAKRLCLCVYNIVSCYLIINMARVDSTRSSIILSLHPEQIVAIVAFLPSPSAVSGNGRSLPPPWWGSPTNSSGRPSCAKPQRSPGAWHERHRLARHCTRPHPRPQGGWLRIEGSDSEGQTHLDDLKKYVEKNASTFFGVEHFVSLSDSTKKKKKKFAGSKAIISR